MQYPLLFSRARIGTLELPNRIIMGSMHLGYEGVPGGCERMAEFYAARAKGGAALIITGGCAINQEAVGGANFSCIFRQEDLRDLAYVAKRTHEEGGRIGLQLFHAGRYAYRQWLNGLQPVAPSAIRSTLHPHTPRELNEEEIQKTIADFATAAMRAKEIGFDCVEVMGSEGYLINQFFSPLTNKRDDRWGGSTENRTRFGVEVMRAIRSQCGADFPVIYRMSGMDLMPGSNVWEETFYFAKSVETAGADALNIGIGWHESRIPTISMFVPRAYYSFASRKIKEHVRISCICSNRINDPDVAEEVLQNGSADFVSLARALLADADFVAKAHAGNSRLINNCIACNQACLDNAFRNEPTACILNAEAGREAQMRLQPTTYQKRLAVVGAGPAGLEASKILAQRGHHVTLFERREKIGGQLLYAVQVPGKEEFFGTLRYYENYLKELQVAVELRCTVTAEELQSFDEVIIATGAKPFLPEIPGIDQSHCWNYDRFFNQQAMVDSDVVIIGAGGIGCDIAHMLSESRNFYPPPSFFDDPNRVAFYEEHIRSFPRTRNVSLTRRGKRIGEKLGPTTRWALMQLLQNRGVQMLTQIAYRSIDHDCVTLITRTDKEVKIPARTVILATGQIPDDEFYSAVKTRIRNCHLIGAAKFASETNAQSAIWEAAELAREI